MGNILTGIIAVFIGLLLVSIFAGPILDQFASSGQNTNIASFSGGRATNDLFVIVYYIIGLTVILTGVGLTGSGIKRRFGGE